MSAFIGSIGMPQVVAGIMVIALNAYALLGGADFGGGVWDLLATGPRREAQREHIATSLAPIWEANHVWLILVVVLLFTAFPGAFQALAIVLHIPLTIMLVGIVLRGTAFVFRSYGSRTVVQRQRWGLTFAVASVVTPIILGMIIGALVSGDVGIAAKDVDGGKATFGQVFVMPWIGIFPLVVGLMALALFAFLAAVYLAYGASDVELREDFRRRALGSAVAVFLLAGLSLLVGHHTAPSVTTGITGAAWAIPLQLLTAVAAIGAVAALWRRDYRIARAAAGAQVTCIIWGWALSQYPYVVPDTLTIDDTAAPRETLVLLLVGLAIGGLILIPSLRYLYRLFGRPTRA